MDRWMAGEARVIRAYIYIELLEARLRRSAADSIRSVSEVEEVVCVCEGNRGYIVELRPKALRCCRASVRRPLIE